MIKDLMSFPKMAEIPPNAKLGEDVWSRRYLIDGEVRFWRGPTMPVRSPICVRDEQNKIERVVLGEAPLLDAAEALAALQAARVAWDNGRGAWPTMRVARRIGCLEKFVAGMSEKRETVVRLLMWEICKSRADAENEFDRTIVYMRDTIEELKRMDRDGGRFVMEEGTIGQIRRSPLGVVLCLGPFNYPLNETFTTLIPALIMGNPVVSKLPKYGTLLHAPLLEAMAQAFPKGVVNIIQGDGPTVIAPLMESGQIDALAFIGTSRVANILQKQHPRPNRLRSILGLEAKNPAIILPSADLDTAVRECLAGSLSFNGQRCTAIKLIFVHESRAAQFVEKFSAAVNGLRSGLPWEDKVKITPLPEENKPELLAAFVEDALAQGARVVNQGGGAKLATYFAPAVVYPVKPGMRLFSEEQFGPIVPVATYREESEIDEFMQASAYGQQVALFGQDAKHIANLVDVMANQVSRINLNTQCRRGPDTFPFTGRKDSAEGTLSVHDALRAFSIRTLVATASTEENKALVSEIVSQRASAFLNTDFVF